MADIVGALPAETVATLKTLAEINLRRSSAAFSAVAVAYVSLPVALGALLSEIAPEVMRDFVFSNGSFVVGTLAGLAFGPLTYFGGMWRARQLEWTIELVSAGAISSDVAVQPSAAIPASRAARS